MVICLDMNAGGGVNSGFELMYDATLRKFSRSHSHSFLINHKARQHSNTLHHSGCR